jgi:hypothetical protein
MPVTDETRERLRQAVVEAEGADRSYEREIPVLPPIPTDEGDVVAVIRPRVSEEPSE